MNTPNVVLYSRKQPSGYPHTHRGDNLPDWSETAEDGKADRLHTNFMPESTERPSTCSFAFIVAGKTSQKGSTRTRVRVDASSITTEWPQGYSWKKTFESGGKEQEV